jgi:hypothetical protein
MKRTGPPIVSMCLNTRNSFADLINLKKCENFNFRSFMKLLLILEISESLSASGKNRFIIKSISIVEIKSIKNQLCN